MLGCPKAARLELLSSERRGEHQLGSGESFKRSPYQSICVITDILSC
jgi:hypothetical protein